MFKVDINNTRSRPHSSFLTQSERLIPYQDFEVFIIANRQGIVQKSHNLLFHRDFWLLLDIFQSLYFSESDMFYVCRWRKSRLVDIFVNKSHSLFCYVSQSINYFLVLYSLYEMSFLSSVLSARSYLELTDAGCSSLFKIEHVESQFYFSSCKMQIYFLLICHPMCSPIITSSQEANWEYSGARVSQYNSSEQASVRPGVGEVSPATSRDQLKTTRWRFYNGQDWDTGHWWWPTPGWLWHRPHPLATYWLGPLLCLVFDFEYKTSTDMFLNMQDLSGKNVSFFSCNGCVVVKEGVILRLPHPSIEKRRSILGSVCLTK